MVGRQTRSTGRHARAPPARALPGTVSNTADVLAIIDLFVLPHSSVCPWLLEAMSAGRLRPRRRWAAFRGRQFLENSLSSHPAATQSWLAIATLVRSEASRHRLSAAAEDWGRLAGRVSRVVIGLTELDEGRVRERARSLRPRTWAIRPGSTPSVRSRSSKAWSSWRRAMSGASPPRGPDTDGARPDQHDRRDLREAVDSAAAGELLGRMGVVGAFDEEHAQSPIRHARKIRRRIAPYVVDGERQLERVKLLAVVRRVDGYGVERFARSRSGRGRVPSPHGAIERTAERSRASARVPATISRIFPIPGGTASDEPSTAADYRPSRSVPRCSRSPSRRDRVSRSASAASSSASVRRPSASKSRRSPIGTTAHDMPQQPRDRSYRGIAVAIDVPR